MKGYEWDFDKRFVYALILVLLLVFALFFINKVFDISPISFTVKEINKETAGSEFLKSLDEESQELKEKASETFKNSILP